MPNFILLFSHLSLILSLTTPFSLLRYAWDFSTFERRIFMGFWIFMCVTVLLIPFLMISFGGLFSRSAPKEINSAFGYRTSMSMKNADTWQFAHHYFGKIWRTLGWILIIPSVIPMLFVWIQAKYTWDPVHGSGQLCWHFPATKQPWIPGLWNSLSKKQFANISCQKVFLRYHFCIFSRSVQVWSFFGFSCRTAMKVR